MPDAYTTAAGIDSPAAGSDTGWSSDFSQRGRGSNLGSKRRTLNAQDRISNSECCVCVLDVRRWTLDVFRLQTELLECIRAEIKKRGPQSFAWFMAQALYHPAHGYYSADRAAIGRRGDYFTNVIVGPLFGELLAAQFVEIWTRPVRINHFLFLQKRAPSSPFSPPGPDYTPPR